MNVAVIINSTFTTHFDQRRPLDRLGEVLLWHENSSLLLMSTEHCYYQLEEERFPSFAGGEPSRVTGLK